MMSDLDRTALCVVGEKIWLPSRDVRSELLIVLHVPLQIPDPFRRCIWSSQLGEERVETIFLGAWCVTTSVV